MTEPERCPWCGRTVVLDSTGYRWCTSDPEGADILDKHQSASPVPGRLLTRRQKIAAAAVGAELGVTYGIPTLRLIYQVLVDLDAAAQALTSWAKAAGGTTGGVVRSIENAGGGTASSVALGQAYEAAAAAKSPVGRDLAAVQAMLAQVREVDIGWVAE